MNTQTLTLLKRLQAAEIQRREARQSLESAERRVERYQRRLDECDEQIKTTEELLVEKQARLTALSSEIAGQEQSLSVSSDTDESQVSETGRESPWHGLGSKRAELMRLEHGKTQLAQEIEHLQSQCEEIRRRRATIVRDLTGAKRHFSSCSSADECALQQKATIYKTCADHLEAEEMGVFEAAGRLHDGEGLAQLVKIHHKREEYSCSGCNMSVSLDTVDSLRRSDAVARCNLCGRILYIGDDDDE